MPTEVERSDAEAVPGVSAAPHSQSDLQAIDHELADALSAHQRVNQLGLTSPLSPRFWFRKVVRRSLAWYTLPIQLFQQAILTALRRMLTTLQAQQATLAGQTPAVHELRDHQASLAQKHASLLERFDRLEQIAQLTPSSKLLRENDRIVEYWNRAAESDPMHETVTQRPGETDEQYQENWKKTGEYLVGKIMSYSTSNPVALEIGPGMGRITVPMSSYCKSITALDISPVMAVRAHEATAHLKNVEVQIITDEDLGFLPSEHFDLAYSIACFQHADKKTFYRYLEGVRRALKPGGVLFFGVLDLSPDAGWGHFEAIVRNDYPQFLHTPDEVSCYLKHAGYGSYEFRHEGETLWAIARR